MDAVTLALAKNYAESIRTGQVFATVEGAKLPDLNTTDDTLTIYGGFWLNSGKNSASIQDTRVIPLTLPSRSNTNIIFSFSTESFRVEVWNYVLKANEVLVGQYNNVYKRLHFISPYTVNGKSIEGLGPKSVGYEHLNTMVPFIYPYPHDSLYIEIGEGSVPDAYFKAARLYVRNQPVNPSHTWADVMAMLPDRVVTSPKGVTECLEILDGETFVYNMIDRRFEIAEWNKVQPHQFKLLQIANAEITGPLADRWNNRMLIEKIESIQAASSFIPDYWREPLESAIERVRFHQDSAGRKAFSFGMITDIHFNPRNTGFKVKSPYLLGELLNRCNVPFFIANGDFGNQQNGEEGRDRCMSDYHQLVDMFRSSGILHKMLPTIGNHDHNTQNWYGPQNGPFENVYVDNDALYSIFFRHLEELPRVSYPDNGRLYYSVDDPSNKVRYIMLNSNDGEWTPSLPIRHIATIEQITWFKSMLETVPGDDWYVVVASHIAPIPTPDPETNSFQWWNNDLAVGLVKAYVNRGSYSGTNSKSGDSISADFSGAKGTLVGWFCGHDHRDRIISVDDVFTVVCTADDGRRTTDDPVKTIGTPTEHVMDVFTVDKTTRTVHITRLGAGEDRSFTF